jgi:hypothetical protein
MTRSAMDRLRAANPIPRPTEASDSALFSEITSQPPDVRLRRWTVRHHRLIVISVVTLGALVLLCSSALALAVESGWIFYHSEGVSPKVTEQEFLNAESQLSLPPGYSWRTPHEPPNSRSDPGAGGSEAVTSAIGAWQDYWVHAIRSGDRAAQERAFGELTALLDHHVVVAPAHAPENGLKPKNPPEGPYAIYADDGGIQMLRATYADAAADKPETLIQINKANPYPDDHSIVLELWRRPYSVRQGATVKLKMNPYDMRSDTITITITIKQAGQIVKTLVFEDTPTNRTVSCPIEATLAPGAYTWSATATDAAGRATEEPTDPLTLSIKKAQ